MISAVVIIKTRPFLLEYEQEKRKKQLFEASAELYVRPLAR